MTPGNRIERAGKWRPAGLEVLASAPYRALLTSEVVADFAGTMRLAAQSWVVLDLTGSPLWVGLAAGARAAPALLLGLLGGVAADRLDRKRIVAWGWGVLGVLAVVTAALVASDALRAWHIVVLSAATGVVLSFSVPAAWAMVPGLVPTRRLQNALAMSSLAWSFGEMAGPAVAGALIAASGAGAAFWVIAAGYAVSVALLMRLKLPPREERPVASVASDLREGLAHVRKTKPLTLLTVLAVEQNLLAVGAMPLIPVYARDVLNVGPSGYGLLAGAMGAGFLLGAMCVAVFGNLPRKGLTLVIAGLVWDACSVSFGFSRVVPLSAALLFTMGFVGPYWVNAAVTIFQTRAGDAMRGRVMSVWGITSEMFPVGWLVGGALAQAFGNEEALIICAVCGTPVALAFYLLSRPFREA